MNEERRRIEALVAACEADPRGQVRLEKQTFLKMARTFLSFGHEELARARVALREVTRRLQLAEKVSGIGHWYYRVGAEDVIWSAQVFDIHGMEPTGKPVPLAAAIDAYHRDDRDQVREYLKAALEKGAGFEFELRLVREDGSVRYVLACGEPEKDASGRVLALFGLFQDITERVRRERLQAGMHKTLQREVQRRTRALRTANQELKDYAYIVSHDLRAPLINIIGFSGDLAATLAEVRDLCDSVLEGLPEDVRAALSPRLHEEIPESVAYIHSNALKMDRLIGQLLELSRLGSRVPRIETVDLAAATRRVLASLAYQLDAAHVETRIGDLPELPVDAVNLEIILNNLLSNAVKYLQPELPGRIAVDAVEKDGFVTLRIADNGRGIAADDLGKVFLPFHRAGGGDVQGEGMGLAYVHMAVRQCGGHIQATSEPGRGSTFFVSLPQKPGAAHAWPGVPVAGL